MKNFLIIILSFALFMPVTLFSQDSKKLTAFYNDDHKYGFKDSLGNVVVPCIYQQVNKFKEGFASVKKNDRWGFINSRGEEITDFIYDTMEDGFDYADYYFKDGLAIVSKNRNDGCIDTLGNEIIPLIYGNLSDFSDGKAIAKLNSFNFYINKKGEIIELKDKDVSCYVKGSGYLTWYIIFENGKFGFNKKEGEEITPPKYDMFKNFDGKSILVKLNGKWSKIDETGKEIYPFIYDDITFLFRDFLFVRIGDLWGLAGENLNPIFDCKYDEMKLIKEYIFAKQNGKLYVLFKDGHLFSLSKYFTEKENFDKIFLYDKLKIFNNCLIVTKKGKYGMFNLITGKEIIKCKYDGLRTTPNGMSAAVIDSKWALINTDGDILTPFKYDINYYNNEFFSMYQNDNIFTFMINEKFGLLDTLGNEVAPAKYDDIGYFTKDMKYIKVQIDNKHGYINRKGEEIIPVIYDYIDYISLGRKIIKVQKDKKWGYINTKGEEVISAKYDELNDFYYGLASFSLNGDRGAVDTLGRETFEKDIPEILIPFCKKDLWGYCDIEKNIIIPAKFQETFPFDGNLAKVKKYGDYGLIDRLGVIVLKAKYDDISNFKDGEATALIGKYQHYIDKKGKLIKKEKYKRPRSKILLKSRYGYIFAFYNNLARITDKGKYGYINEKDELVIPAVFDDAYPFKEGRALVKKNGKFGFIDTKGKEISKMVYDTAASFNSDMALVKLNGKYGYINNAGKLVLDIKYVEASDFCFNYAKIRRNNKYSYINKAGEEYFFEGKYDTVVVNNINQLLESIASNRCVILNTGKYEISKFEGVEDAKSESYDRYKDIDVYISPVVHFETSRGLVIKNAHNLKLIGKSNDAKDTKIISDDVSDDVFNFVNCSNITVENLDIGHVPNTMGGHCVAGVIDFNKCGNMNFNNSILYGCGALGFRGETGTLYCNNTVIKECSQGIMHLRGNNFTFDNCRFYDNKTFSGFISVYGEGECTLNNCEIINNMTYEDDEGEDFFTISEHAKITLNNCEMIGNTAKRLTSQKQNLILNKVKAENNSFKIE